MSERKNCSDCKHKGTFTYTPPNSLNKITFPACTKDSMPLMKADNECNSFVREEKAEVKSDV